MKGSSSNGRPFFVAGKDSRWRAGLRLPPFDFALAPSKSNEGVSHEENQFEKRIPRDL